MRWVRRLMEREGLLLLGVLEDFGDRGRVPRGQASM